MWLTAYSPSSFDFHTGSASSSAVQSVRFQKKYWWLSTYIMFWLITLSEGPLSENCILTQLPRFDSEDAMTYQRPSMVPQSPFA